MRVSALERVQSGALLAPRQPEALCGKHAVLGVTDGVFPENHETSRHPVPCSGLRSVITDCLGEGGPWPSKRQLWGLGPLPQLQLPGAAITVLPCREHVLTQRAERNLLSA